MFENNEKDDYELLADMTSRPNVEIKPPADLLSNKQIESVRFNVSRKGYSFSQVELFIDRATSTLTFYENALKTIEKAYHEQSEDLQYKEDQVSQMKATIEAFRTKVDPVVPVVELEITETQIMESDTYRLLHRDNISLQGELEFAMKSLFDAREEIVVQSRLLVLATTAVDKPVIKSAATEIIIDDIQEDIREVVEVEELTVFLDIEDPATDGVNIDEIDSSDEPAPASSETKKPSLLAFAPEALGVDIKAIPEEKIIVDNNRPETLDNAPETRR
jgi:cell division septum initiation protein DivIVA